jgi:hypothetical protein
MEVAFLSFALNCFLSTLDILKRILKEASTTL